MRTYVGLVCAIMIAFSATLAGVYGCGGTDDATGDATDSSVDALSDVTSTDSAHGDEPDVSDAGTVQIVHLDNGECLPLPLTTDDAGNVSCRIAIDIPSGGCASRGYPPLDDADRATLIAGFAAQGRAPPDGDFCAIPQIDDAGCSLGPGAGFCYVQGSCPGSDAGCDQAFCTAQDFDAAPEEYEYLFCP
ncbi:MAG: hypothetical protein ACRELY_28585 [Polyangiaceae bacterium]